MNIVDPILFQCRRQPPLTAICAPGPGIGRISYRRLEKAIHNISRKLHVFGVSKGAVLAVSIEDVILHAAVTIAAIRLGLITLSLRSGQSPPSLKIDAIVTDLKISTFENGKIILADISWMDGEGQPLEPHLLPQTDEDDICRLVLTSGTTKAPKAVALSHKLLTKRIGRTLTVFGDRLVNCSRIYNDVPISSSLGIQFLFYTLWRGGLAVFSGPDFGSTLRVIEDYKVQGIVSSPGGLENLLRWFDTIPEYQSGIEVVLTPGDVLSRALSDRVRARICSQVFVAYGSTEASMSATAYAREVADAPQAVGFVTPGVTIQIIDETGGILPAGQEGRVRIRSEFAVDQYFENLEASESAFRDGWFYPGDLGMLNSESMLFITGRQEAVLNLGGDKISPETIELVLSQCRGVTEAAVLALPNAFGINEVCAVLLSSDKVDREELQSYCRARIDRPFWPTRFVMIESLPRNPMGKVDRRRLSDLVERKMAALSADRNVDASQ